VTILFAHGIPSGPTGRKPRALREAGYELIVPDCRELDLAQRVEVLVEVLVEAERPPLLVGSSFGGMAGLVAGLVAAERGVVVPGLVLCAPALMLPIPKGTVRRLRCPAPTIIVHGTRDEVIPIDVSRRFARKHGALLREVDDDHDMRHAGQTALLAAVRELHDAEAW
jgi:pimeloyl-ACP methyl ester carboxylesterase